MQDNPEFSGNTARGFLKRSFEWKNVTRITKCLGKFFK